MPQVITANRLVDGDVVYLTGDEQWSELLSRACLAEDKRESDRLMEIAERAVSAQLVVAPYVIDVIAEEGTIRARRYREHIRASGPTIRTDLGKQAAQG